MLWQPGLSSPRSLIFSVRTRVLGSWDHTTLQSSFQQVDLLWSSHNANAPAACSHGFHTSRWWAALDEQNEHVDHFTLTTILSLLVVTIVLAIVTKSPALTFLGVLTVTLSVGCTFGSLPLVMNRVTRVKKLSEDTAWELRMFESMLASMLIGQTAQVSRASLVT
eukprot:COSAG01_NODE_987_length_12316_cov_167.856348_9_plen_165_part_00